MKLIIKMSTQLIKWRAIEIMNLQRIVLRKKVKIMTIIAVFRVKMITKTKTSLKMRRLLQMSFQSQSSSLVLRLVLRSSSIANLARLCQITLVVFLALLQIAKDTYPLRNSHPIFPPLYISSGYFFQNTLYHSAPILILASPSVRASSSINISILRGRDI